MVSGMSDVFSKEKNGWRSISSGTLHHIMYLLIIATEISIAVLVWAGVISMIEKFKSGADEFNLSKKLLLLGLSVGVILWFTLFIAIGGEWFLMWQSKNWNGQQTAFLLSICFLLFLIQLNQDDA
jgi:predicted small integral membrane protein